MSKHLVSPWHIPVALRTGRGPAGPLIGVQSVRLAGSEHPCQDAWSVHGAVAWVIDGASRPTAPAGHVEQYVAALSRALHDVLEHRPHAPLVECLRAAIEATCTDHASATVAMARATRDGFDWLVLGDAAIFTTSGGLVRDRRLAAVGAGIRAERARERIVHGVGPRFVELTRQLLALEDAHRNRPGGFWVAGGSPDAAGQALVGHAAAGRIVLMTDGILDVAGADLVELVSDDLGEVVRRWRGQLLGPVDDITVLQLRHDVPTGAAGEPCLECCRGAGGCRGSEN